MDDKIKVTCTRCRAIFREKASRVRDGYPAIRKAMTEARRRRNSYVMPTQGENV
jgi:hypothetical protein